MLQLSPGKTPARGGEAGYRPGQREQRRPAAGCSHGKTHRGAGAPGRGRPCHPRWPAGAGLLSGPAPERSSRVEREAEEDRKCHAGRVGLGWRQGARVPVLWMLCASLPAVHTP